MNDFKNYEIMGFDLLLLIAIWYRTQNIWWFLLILFLMVLIGIVFYLTCVITDCIEKTKDIQKRLNGTRIKYENQNR